MHLKEFTTKEPLEYIDLCAIVSSFVLNSQVFFRWFLKDILFSKREMSHGAYQEF